MPHIDSLTVTIRLVGPSAVPLLPIGLSTQLLSAAFVSSGLSLLSLWASALCIPVRHLLVVSTLHFVLEAKVLWYRSLLIAVLAPATASTRVPRLPSCRPPLFVPFAAPRPVITAKCVCVWAPALVASGAMALQRYVPPLRTRRALRRLFV